MNKIARACWININKNKDKIEISMFCRLKTHQLAKKNVTITPNLDFDHHKKNASPH